MSETARTRNPWGQGDRLRAEILDAASGLLDRLGGEDAITIRGVARAAGIAPASIYQHFTDRAALIDGLVEHDSHRLLAAMSEAAAGDDPIEGVRARLRAYATFALDNPGHYRLMLARLDGGRRVAVRAVVQSLTESLQSCVDAGTELRLPVERAAIMLFVAAHGRVALVHADAGADGLTLTLSFLDELLTLVVPEQTRR